MLPGDTAALRKARGAFFTPAPVARFIADWAVKSSDDDILEPSCGEAVFLHEAGRSGSHGGRLVGFELHDASARQAERTLNLAGINAAVEPGDFFEHEPDGSFDVVIGNPPYVRYQDFSGEARARSRRAALRAGVSLSGLASSWAAFTVHSALFLKPGGRLGLVLPAELLTVNYAADVRRFLMQHFRSVGLVMFVERVFPGVQEEVVLLLADGFDPSGKVGTDHCEVYQLQNVAELVDFGGPTKWTPTSPSAKWSASVMPAAGFKVYAALSSSNDLTALEMWGDTTLGMVTGNNKYFCMSPSRAQQLGLEDDELVPLSPPGSRHLRGLRFSRIAHERMGREGASTLLFRPAGNPSAAGQRYIEAGEGTAVDLAYKCRVRSPWWRVPNVRPADLLLTYMNADTARLCTNRAGVHHLNSVHGVYLRPELRKLGMDLLALAALNSVTVLGAETVGRAYGGGMLKMEPREADQWPMPSPQLVAKYRGELVAIRDQVAKHLAGGHLEEAVSAVDEVLLHRGLGVSQADLNTLRNARNDLVARRVSRGREVGRG